MIVLVTGSEGFIGRAVVQRLFLEGVEPVGLDHRSPGANPAHVRAYQCDILDRDRLFAIFREVRPDAVLHLAARTDLKETRNLAGYAANIEGVRNVVDAVTEANSIRRAVYTSSQLVCRIGYVPKHDQDYRPSTLYGESKVRTEQIVRDQSNGVPSCLVRPTTVWGPHMKPHYRRVLHLIQAGRYFHVGSQPLFKSYGYVGNVAYQYWKVLQAPADAIDGKTYFVADYEPLSLRSYLDALSRELRGRELPSVPVAMTHAMAVVGETLNRVGWKSFPFNRFRLRNILTEYLVDTKPIREIAGTLPYTFDEGIAETLTWFRHLPASADSSA